MCRCICGYDELTIQYSCRWGRNAPWAASIVSSERCGERRAMSVRALMGNVSVRRFRKKLGDLGRGEGGRGRRWLRNSRPLLLRGRAP